MLDDKGVNRTWNHRVVRRYAAVPEKMQEAAGTDEQTWLEITEVHYAGGKPVAFALELGTPMAPIEDDQTVEGALSEIRLTLERMLAATSKPILDEKTDFPRSGEKDPPTKCTGCGDAMGAGTAKNAMYLCDEDEDGNAWCGECFDQTPCGKGEHGEGCETMVVDPESYDNAPTDPTHGGKVWNPASDTTSIVSDPKDFP